MYLVPIPALEKGEASQNGNIKSIETPLLETERRDIHQKTDFNEYESALPSNPPAPHVLW